MTNVGPGEFHVGMIGGMHAIEVTETGGPEVLTYVEKPDPTPGPGEVLIKADAIGVNFIDTYFRSGLYPREVPFVVGTEVCGTVAAVGDDVAALDVGDRVVTAQADGAYAEYCVGASRFRAPTCPTPCRAGGGRVLAAEGHDGALPAQVGLPGTAGRHRPGARRRGRCRPDPHAVGHQHGGAGDHHGVDAGEGRAVPAGGRDRGARLPGRPGRVRRQGSASSPTATASPRCTTGSARRRSRPAWPAWPCAARSRCSARPADRSRRSTRSDSTQRGSLFLTRPNAGALHPHAPTNSPGGQANCSTRSPRTPST